MMTIMVREGHEAKYDAWQESKRLRSFTGKVKVRGGKKVPANVKAAVKTANRNQDLYAWLCDAFYAGQVDTFNVVDADQWMVNGGTFTTADLRRFASEDVAQAA